MSRRSDGLPMLLGRLPNSLSVDPKGRLVVPSRLRESVADEDGVARFYVGHLIDRCLYLHTEEQHQTFVDAFDSVVDDTANNRRLKTRLHSSFAPVATDKSGRISIPARLLGRAEIEHEVVLIGMPERVEIWAAESFESLEETSEDEFAASLEAAWARSGAVKRAAKAGEPSGG